jgi:hypothetical protein
MPMPLNSSQRSNSCGNQVARALTCPHESAFVIILSGNAFPEMLNYPVKGKLCGGSPVPRKWGSRRSHGPGQSTEESIQWLRSTRRCPDTKRVFITSSYWSITSSLYRDQILRGHAQSFEGAVSSLPDCVWVDTEPVDIHNRLSLAKSGKQP